MFLSQSPGGCIEVMAVGEMAHGGSEMSVAWPGSSLGQTPALINVGFWLSLVSKKGVRWGTGGDRSLWKAKKLQSNVNLYLDMFLQNKDNVDGIF